MKNKIFKLGLFSLLSLGALASVSATLTSKSSIAKDKVSLNTENKPTTSVSTSSNREWPTSGDVILEQDEVLDQVWEPTGEVNLYLNGYVLSIAGDNYIHPTQDAVVNIYDYKETPPEAKPIHKFRVDEEHHYWVIDEQNGDIEVEGGVIYAANHSTTKSMFLINVGDTGFNIYDGTICGGGTAAFTYTFNVCLNSVFNMYGGAIRGNSLYASDTDEEKGAGAAIRLRTIYNYVSSFIMYGGVIADNYVYGPYATGGPAISIILNASFVMNGGKITNNITDATESSRDAYGGAIQQYNGFGDYHRQRIFINGGEISNNEIKVKNNNAYGGAIGVAPYGTSSQTNRRDTIVNGGVITNNKLISTSTGKTYGGGIYACNLELHGGEITNNVADYGGGVYAYDNEHISDPNPTSLETTDDNELLITNNTANVEGGGMIVTSATNNISGKVIIKDNNLSTNGISDNLHLYNSLTVTGPLAGSDVHFSSKTLTEPESIKIMDYTEKSGSTRVNEFFRYDGENDKYIDLDSDGNIEVIQMAEGEAHTITTTPCDPDEGSIEVGYDLLPKDKKVKVKVTLTTCHSLEKLVYNDGEDHDITATKSFLMPDKDVTVTATIKNDHHMVHFRSKPATCTEDGWKDYYRCSGCNSYYEDSQAKKLIPDIEAWKLNEGKLPKLGHDLKLIKGKTPTLVEGGYKDYYRCSRCREYFEDKEGKIQILDLEEWKATKGALGPIMGAKNLTITLLVIVAVIIVPIVTAISVIEIKKRRYLRVNNNYLFTDIKYSRTTHPTAPSLDEHTFDFIYQGEHVYYYIFTRKVDKITDKEVKAKFQEILKSGKLRKYSSHYYKKIY